MAAALPDPVPVPVYHLSSQYRCAPPSSLASTSVSSPLSESRLSRTQELEILAR